MRTTKILLFITLSLSAFSQCSLVYNPFTNQFNCGGASGTVGGASNLTTVGAIPYVSAAGILNQDPTALFWDAANNRLGVGTNAPGTPLQVVGQITSGSFTANSPGSLVLTNTINATATRIDSSSDAGRVRLFNSSNATTWLLNADGAASHYSGGNFLIGTTTDDGSNKLQVSGSARVLSAGTAALKVDGGTTQGQWVTGTGFSSIGTVTNDPLVFYTNNVNAARFAPTTGNLLVGASTDSNFKLDVAASGSAGTARFYGGAGVTASTKVVVQAGGGQSGNLQEWQAANGGVRASVGSVGDFIGSSYDNGGTWEAGSSLNRLSNTYRVQWSSTGSYAGAADLSLSRASAGVLQVGDGGSNANGQVSARAVNAVSSLAAFNSTGGIYMSGNAGSSWGTIQSYSDGSGTAKATAINPTGGNLLIGTTTDDGTNKLQVATPAGAIVANTAFLSPSMANGNKVYLTIGTSSSSNNSFTWLYNHSSTSSSRYLSVQPYEGQIGSSSTWFASSNMTVGDVTAAPLDPGFRFSVRSSGSSGTFRIFDEVPTTGSTKAVIRAGAGQSTTNLTEWQDNGGTVLSAVRNDGVFLVDSGVFQTGNNWLYAGTNFDFRSTFMVRWTNGGATDTKDLGLSRSSAGLLEINSGTAGTYRDLILRRSQHNGVTVADLPAAAAGNAGSIQYVTDANATTIGSTVAGGGANKVMVWSDGAAWKIFAN